ncbi:MAG: hypothetical protein HKN16_01125, partial [Saprospiraceae bacterium]|nr:hypothetical protein [Saprospiraceae bacterium]
MMSNATQSLNRFPFYLILLLSLSFHLGAQPDLVVVQSTLSNSIYGTTLTNNDDCLVQEGCVGGYGSREIIRFSTHVRNIGDQDFYVGQPPNSPSQSNESESWEWDECHNHWHYEGYAEYLLFDASGTLTPIGYKNGFCLLDIECNGGGTYTYTCSNQGISAGCGDIYGSGLPCQWVDVTGVPDGTYSLVVRANWDASPDANGVYESTYDNNEAEVCFNLTRDSNGDPEIEVLGNSCNPNTDCFDVTLNLVLDEYPGETSWEVRDNGGTVVYTGGPYNLSPDGSNHSVTLCLDQGCYDLVVLDSHGDGLCCGYGEGSYQLSDGSGNILASGGSFGFSETTNFCVGPPTGCVDEDSDGLCVEDDCNDNDPYVPAAPGVACDDGDPDTTGDVILADGCTCEGVPCIDGDNDGWCSVDDCDDSDPNLPTTAGSTCDDGDANTENDIFLSDGCTCEGTPIPPVLDCDGIEITSTEDQILVQGFENFPHVNIQIFSPTWSLINSCVDNCGTDSYLTAGYEPGIHWVSVKTFDDYWGGLCDILVPLPVEGSTGPCTDEDGDGYCNFEDCDDSDPGLPASPGTTCDDGNAATINDMIQQDGCSCAGELPPPPGCETLQATGHEGYISISGFGSYAHHNIQIFNSGWSVEYSCPDNCLDPLDVYLPEGSYIVSVKTFNQFWQDECDLIFNVVVSGAGGPCPDSDGDGICAGQDCD